MIIPSFLSVAGIKPDSEFDGEDFTGVLFNNEEMPKRSLFWRYRNQRAVKNGVWKYLKINDEEYLFNLKDDIPESKDVKDLFPEIVKSLKQQLNNWETEMNNYQQQTN